MRRLLFAWGLLLILPAVGHAETYRFSRYWPTLQQPWYFNYPNAAAADSRGYVYIADGGNGRIVKFTSGGQFVHSWAGPEDGSFFFDEPIGIAIDPLDQIYVADQHTYFVDVFTPDAKYIRTWSLQDDQGDSFLPSDIEVDGSGHVFVVDSPGKRIHVFSDQGEYIGRWNGGENGGVPFQRPFGVGVDEFGHVFVSDIDADNMRGFTVKIEGANLEVSSPIAWGEFGTEPGKFRDPYGISVRDGEVFVMDIRNDRVQVFDLHGTFLRQFGEIGDSEEEFYAATGIAATSDGLVYVAGKNQRRLQKFRTDGEFLMSWQSMGIVPGKLQLPRGTDADASGNLFVADTNNNRIQVFSPEGRVLDGWGEPGTGPGQFNLPYDVEIIEDVVYVADINNHRVQFFSLEGAYRGEWTAGEEALEFDPQNLSAAPDGRLFATNVDADLVHWYDPETEQSGLLLERAEADALLSSPQGIAIDGGYVWVSDEADNIHKFQLDGTFLETWNRNGTGEEDWFDLNGLWAENERLYVADAFNNRIQVYDYEGNYLETIGNPGSGPGQFRTPTDLCIHENRLYVTDSDNNRIQVFERVETIANRKAILVAGGGPYEGNLLWDATRLNAGFALRALAFQGFAAPDIRYLTADDRSDLDFDGEPDPVFAPTLDELAAAVEWAGDADQVVIYLVNHGGVNPEGAGVFRMSPTENLTGAALSGRLEGIQTDGNPEIILVSDFCAAGRFLEDVAEGGADGPLLVSSTTGDEEAYFLGQGAGSFSNGFWTGVFNGLDVRESFVQGREAVGVDPERRASPLQNPFLDVDGDGVDDSEDGQAGRGKFIGNGSAVSGASVPEILTVATKESELESGVGVTVELRDPKDISRVWVVVRPPGDVAGSDLLPPDTPILELPAIDLEYTGDGNTYSGRLTGLGESGNYTLLAFAADRDGNTSPPFTKSLDVGSATNKKAVLLAAGDTADPGWPAAETAIERAYTALRFQGYADADIRAFAPETFFGGIFGAPSLDNLAFAFSDWIEDGVKDVVFFWIGAGDSGGLPLSDGETLTPETLDDWLDELQTRISSPVVVIADSDGAGGWISDLVPPAGKERIVLTSASADGAALRSPEGAVSFSSLFWKEILAGRTVGRAFLSARNAAAFFGDGLETGPQWDDNGNGIAGERGEGNLALRTVVGAGIQLAANDPTAADVSEERIDAEEGQPVSLRISGVQSGSGTVSVTAVVASPDGTTTEIPLTLEGGTGDYTGQFDAFTASGFYPVSYFAVNAEGAVSPLGEQTIFQPFGEDVFDFGDASDDSSGKATLLVVNDPSPDHHNFFEAEDPDWFMFFAIQGEAYEIRARASVVSGSGEPVFFSLFSEEAFTPLETRESAGDATELDWIWECPSNGIYQIKVQSANSGAEGSDTGYTIQVVRPVGPFAGFLQGVVLDAESGAPLPYIRLRTSANASALTRPNGRFLMIHEPGEFQLTIEGGGANELLNLTVSVSDLGTTEIEIFYEYFVTQPHGNVSGIIRNQADFSPISNASIRTSDDVTAISRPNGRFLFFHPPGIFEIIMEASGFQTFRQNMQVNSLGSTELEIFLVPSFSSLPSINAEFFVKPRIGSLPQPFEFTDLSSVSSGAILSWDWDFGDGTTSSESNPVHVYEEPGTYTVRLRVFGSNGNSDTEVRTDLIQVSEALQPGAPVANFEMSPAAGTVPFTISLSDRSTGEITERIWQVDGEVFAENISDPTYVLEECRDYEISLTVTGPGGGTDTISQTVNCGDETPTTGVVQGRIGGIPPGTGFTLEIAREPVFVDGDGNFRLELLPGEYPLTLVATDPISGTSQTWNESLNLSAGETATWDFTVSDWWTPPVFQPSAPEVLLPNPEEPQDSQGQVRLTAQFEPIREGQSIQSARWQIAESPDFAAVGMDIASEDYWTEFPVPMLVLKPETVYHFRVRFADETGMDSEWSAVVDFTTPADPEDADGNGVPDAQAAPDPATGNPWGTAFSWLYTASGNSRVGLEIPPDSGTVAAVRTLHPDDIPESPGRPDSLPLGLLAFRCEGLAPGASLSATVHFTREIPADTGWVLADPLADWQSWPADRAAFNPDRTAITLTLADGGFGDVDGVANGVIVAPPSGPGSPPVESRVLFEGPSGGNVGGAGCFLQMIEVNPLR